MSPESIRRRMLLTLALTLGLAFNLQLLGAVVAGFGVEKIVDAPGFLTCIASDPAGAVHFSTRDGGVYRIEGASYRLVAEVPTADVGNAALLGFVFENEHSIIVHTVAESVTADLVSRVDLESGEVSVLARYLCLPGGGPCSSEHHGGNPTIARDGTIFVGLGDFALGNVAQDLRVPGGKIHRLDRWGSAVFASGLRNPFDLQVDEEQNRLIVSENGQDRSDEVHIIRMGDNCGWPLTSGYQAQPVGTATRIPSYVFPATAAPTGAQLLEPYGVLSGRGLLLTTFVSKSLLYFPSVDVDPLPSPRVILEASLGPLIDVTQSSDGAIWIASTGAVYRLRVPAPGDVDGDGDVDQSDLSFLDAELAEGLGEHEADAPGGSVAASWGADVNRDGRVTETDRAALVKLLLARRRVINGR